MEVLVRYQYIAKVGQSAGTLAPNHRGGVRFGVAPSKTSEEFVAEAVEVAKSVDAVVLIVGLNGDFESEGYDRSHMNLPGNLDMLADAVTKANKKTAGTLAYSHISRAIRSPTYVTHLNSCGPVWYPS